VCKRLKRSLVKSCTPTRTWWKRRVCHTLLLEQQPQGNWWLGVDAT
jgi:hypothetical protein